MTWSSRSQSLRKGLAMSQVTKSREIILGSVEPPVRHIVLTQQCLLKLCALLCALLCKIILRMIMPLTDLT